MSGFDFATASPAEVRAEVARRAARRAAGLPLTADAHVPRGEVQLVQDGRVRGRVVNCAIELDRPLTAPLPARLRIAWSMLAGDNARWAPALRGKKPVLVMTAVYRTAKKKATKALVDQNDQPPMTGRVKVTALLFEPDRRTRRDIANYAKLVHDCLTDAGVVQDDSQIDDVRWIRAGVDIDAPRLELVVEALT